MLKATMIARATLVAGLVTTAVGGQAPRPTSLDSVFARAQRLVATGNGAAGRLLVDSVVAATPPDSGHYAAALLWRAKLATSERDAERDYRRIVVEYPLFEGSGVALLALAGIESARGDRDLAALHLERFVLENPSSAERPSAGLRLSRILFEQNRPARACAALLGTQAATPETSVELRNQVNFFVPQCRAVDTSAAARSAERVSMRQAAPLASNAVGPAGADSGRVPPTASVSSHASAAARFTVQVGAYDSRNEADRVATRLRGQGYEARVIGEKKPFRVHIGRYATRAAAEAFSKQLTAKKIANYVTTISPEER
jgi:cell division septation protein DedD